MSTTTITNSQEVSIVNQSAITGTINNRKERVSKAVKFVETIPSIIQDDETDEKAKVLIGKYKDLEKKLNDERTPITKKFDEIRAMFTEDEKAVKNAIDTLSKRRDVFVTAKAEKIRLANIAAQKERFKTEELIEIKASVEFQLTSWITGLIEKKKSLVLEAMKTITKENKDKKSEGLKNMSSEMDAVAYGNFQPNVISKYDNDVAAISKEIILGFETLHLTHYKKEIETFKHECLMQVNSLVLMDAEEKKAAISAKSDEIKVEASTAIEVAEVHIGVQSDTQKAENAFTSIASDIDNSLPQNRQGFTIEVLNNAGWIAIAKFWLVTLAATFEGNFETKTLKSMKGDLEKYAKDTGTKIDSENLNYLATFKAIN